MPQHHECTYPFDPVHTSLQRHDPPDHEDAMSVYPVLAPKPLRATNPPSFSQEMFLAQNSDTSSTALSEADIDRFATLFSPATPPATPTLTATEKPPLIAPDHPTARPRKSTHSSADAVDFGAFVSVPPSLDPLSSDFDRTCPIASRSSAHEQNHSLVYFDQFTAHAKTAAERSRKEVLDELLEHQDDPLYFLDTRSTASPDLPPSSISTCSATPIPIPMLPLTDDALAEALATDMPNPKLVRAERSGSVKVALSPSRSRLPLPPRLSGTASPPSISSPIGSSPPLPTSSSPLSSTSTLASASGSMTLTHPAHATLSRISSSLVSLLPSTRTRASSPLIPTSAPSITTRSRASTLTHGSPFASTPYIPPTGAPGFAGDRAWDRGFSEALAQEEKRGVVDPVGLGPGAEVAAHTRHGKGRGVTLVGRREGTAMVLTEEMADLVRPHFPALTRLARHWTLLYSLDQHGISLNTLYSRSEPRIPSRAHPNPPKGGLLVIQDANDTVFGAWLSEGIVLSKGGYYGSGESFLWRYHSSREEVREGRLDVYKWTGANAYVALCESGFISFGGGDGHYGLYLDASLLDGSSAPCPTFGNPPLCASDRESVVAKAKGEVPFECVGLEVWGIGSG